MLVQLLHRVLREVLGDRALDLLQLFVGGGVRAELGPVAVRGKPGELRDQLAGSGRAPCRPATRTTRTRPWSARSRGCGRCWRRAGSPEIAGLREAGGVCHVRDEDDLLHRDVDALRPSGPQRASARRTRLRRRCARTRSARCNARARDRDRRCSTCCRSPPSRPRSDARHDGARPVETERRDADPHRTGRARGVELVGARQAGRCRTRRRRRRAARRARGRRPRARARACPAFHARATLPDRARRLPEARRARRTRRDRRAPGPRVPTDHRRDRRRADLPAAVRATRAGVYAPGP